MKNLSKITLLSVMVLLAAGCTKRKSLDTEKEKYSYAIGYQFSKNVKGQAVDLDPAALAMAVEDVANNKNPALSEQEMQQAMDKLRVAQETKMSAAADENKKKGVAWLEENKKKPGVKVTETGLQYKIIQPGGGVSPTEKDSVIVNYKGTLIDGTEFDSSYKRGVPAEFHVAGVIPGFTEALKKMKKGAKWELYIPSELGYGNSPRPGIPAGSVLIFDVELKDIKK